ncbi:MAG: NAD kinase [Chlorobi bacterium]|nr:NAD kinase [Chlorobiota bacterium]
MTIAIYGREVNPGFVPYLKTIFRKSISYQSKHLIYHDFARLLKDQGIGFPEDTETFSSPEEISGDVDIMLSVGGDGTFLEAVSYVRDSDVPIIGINSGRLGFLATISREEIESSLDALFRKEYVLENRTLIKISPAQGLLADFPYALNEFTVQKKGTEMIMVEVKIDGKHLNTYWADGLLISTPTGSTAYSMSVGGPIVIPGSNNFILSPIAPHNLTVRPIVIPDDHELTIRVAERSKQYWVSMDYLSEIYKDHEPITIKKAEFTVQIPKLDFQDYFQTLRSKLMWGADRRSRQ